MSHFGVPHVMTNMDRESELELVVRLRDGDDAAFDAVHAEMHVRLFNFLARLSRNRDVAEDLLEETWLRFVNRASKLHPDTRLAPLLFTIARNLYVSYCRSRLLEDSHAQTLMSLWPAGVPGPSPYEAAAASEIGQRLEAAIAALPIPYREALVLVVIEGVQSSDAAQICGITPDAMRQRVSRARVMVAKRLELDEVPALARLNEVTT